MSSGFSIPGIGSGIDWSTYINSVKTAEQNAIARTLGRQQVKVASQQQTMSSFQTILDALRTSASGFQYAKDFKTKNVTSSDSTVVTGVATLTAVKQTATVSVEQLATNEKWSASFTSVDNAVTSTDGSLVINVRGADKTVNVTAGDSLSTLAQKINSANIGITATVFSVNDGSSDLARLVITDNTTGQADADNSTWHQNISFTSSTLTNLATGAFTNQTQGQDAKVIVNATTVYRDSNEVSDVLPGVTLTLLKADAGVNKTLTVTEDTSSAAQKVATFIDKYNETIKALKRSVFYDTNSSSQSNPTAGDFTLRGIMAQLQGTVTATVRTLPSDAVVKSFADIGITTVFEQGNGQNNGTLKFDVAKFNETLSSNYDDVVQFFEGVTVGSGDSAVKYEGFGSQMLDVIQGFMEANTGSLASRVKQLSEQGTKIDKEISDKLERISKRETAMKDRFARLESVLAQLNSKQSSLTSLLNSVGLNNAAISKG